MEDAYELEADVRLADKQELEALSRRGVRRTLEMAIGNSLNSGAAFTRDGSILALFGVVPYSVFGDTAAPWMVGSTKLFEYPVELTRTAYRFLAQVRPHYPRLLNYVDARNKEAVKWLKHIGFTVDEPAPLGHDDLPFHRFHMGLDNV